MLFIFFPSYLSALILLVALFPANNPHLENLTFCQLGKKDSKDKNLGEILNGQTNLWDSGFKYCCQNAEYYLKPLLFWGKALIRS